MPNFKGNMIMVLDSKTKEVYVQSHRQGNGKQRCYRMEIDNFRQGECKVIAPASSTAHYHAGLAFCSLSLLFHLLYPIKTFVL